MKEAVLEKSVNWNFSDFSEKPINMLQEHFSSV